LGDEVAKASTVLTVVQAVLFKNFDNLLIAWLDKGLDVSNFVEMVDRFVDKRHT
jgi:hypothetical protein